MRFLSSLPLLLSLSSFGVYSTSVVEEEGRDITDLEFAINRTTSGYLSILGLFSDMDGETDVEQNVFRLFAGPHHDVEEDPSERAFVLIQPVDPSVDPLPVPVPSTRDRILDISYVSEFAQIVGFMMLIPTNPGIRGTHFRMISSPSDASDFCVDRLLTILPAITRPDGFPSIRAHAALRTADTNDYMSLSEAFGGYGNVGPYSVESEYRFSLHNQLISLPHSIRRTIIMVAGYEGFTVERRGEFHVQYYLEPGCADIIPRLPTIQLWFTGSDGGHAGNIFLEPNDYMHVDETTGECITILDLNFGERENNVLGVPFFEQMGLFFDYENNQIGICDPL